MNKIKCTILVKLYDIGNLILENLFSEETENFFNSCNFPSTRMAFMQGMNYAALLCNAKLTAYVIQEDNIE